MVSQVGGGRLTGCLTVGSRLNDLPNRLPLGAGQDRPSTGNGGQVGVGIDDFERQVRLILRRDPGKLVYFSGILRRGRWFKSSRPDFT